MLHFCDLQQKYFIEKSILISRDNTWGLVVVLNDKKWLDSDFHRFYFLSGCILFHLSLLCRLNRDKSLFAKQAFLSFLKLKWLSRGFYEKMQLKKDVILKYYNSTCFSLYGNRSYSIDDLEKYYFNILANRFF